MKTDLEKLSFYLAVIIFKKFSHNLASSVFSKMIQEPYRSTHFCLNSVQTSRHDGEVQSEGSAKYLTNQICPASGNIGTGF